MQSSRARIRLALAPRHDITDPNPCLGPRLEAPGRGLSSCPGTGEIHARPPNPHFLNSLSHFASDHKHPHTEITSNLPKFLFSHPNLQQQQGTMAGGKGKGKMLDTSRSKCTRTGTSTFNDPAPPPALPSSLAYARGRPGCVPPSSIMPTLPPRRSRSVSR